MTHRGGTGPAIRETREKTLRRCLNCNKVFTTTIADRLCGACLLRAAELQAGFDEVSLRGTLSHGRSA